jgi:hypothetical protein
MRAYEFIREDQTSSTAQYYDDEYTTVQSLVNGVVNHQLLIHVRINDGTDFRYGIDPSAGQFLRSTEAWQWAQNEFGEGPELTFFSDTFKWLDTDFLTHNRATPAVLEAIFVRKNPTIQKSLGNGQVETANGSVISYEQSHMADYESDLFKDEPAGVEMNDWYTNESQDVVAVVPVIEVRQALNLSNTKPSVKNNINEDSNRPRHNSDGKLIAKDAESLANFWKWFGNSQVVDSQGRPIVAYHGTRADFGEFDISKSSPSNRFGPGFYFTTDKKTFDVYGESGSVMPLYLRIENPINGNGLTVAQINTFFDSVQVTRFPNGYDATEDHVTIKESMLANPSEAMHVLRQHTLYFSNSDWIGGLSRLGYDGIVETVFGSPEYVVWHRNQIKSAIGNRGTYSLSSNNINEEDYRGEHQAPESEGSAPLYDLTINGIYPADVYTYGEKHYGTGESQFDNESFAVVNYAHNRPDRLVKIYRAVPYEKTKAEQIADVHKQQAYILKYGRVLPNTNTSLDSSEYFTKLNTDLEKLEALPDTVAKRLTINSGNWVSLSRSYARDHGKAHLNNKFKVISRTVKASDLYTDGNSINEFGYVPSKRA